MTQSPASQPFRAAFDRTLRLSHYVARMTAAHPALAGEIEARETRAFDRGEMRAALAGDSQPLASRLRALRTRVMVTLAHRDLNGLAPLDEVFATMTALADECIGAAARESHPELIVAALGKLGGEELNVSSDVDLVFLHDSTTADAERFARAGREVIALLSEVTAEGQAFRVDMRLRPFGDSGPLVTSLSSLEDYFVTHARPWERYAWLKSRVIAGPGEALPALVQPFVYRRYLDFVMLEQLRDLHARIFETAVRRRKADDIKVGSGGIREIEFAVQLLQMVRGGREPGLRMTSTRGALQALASRGLIEPPRAKALGDAYAFLRRLEHRLQYYDDQQTQALPRDEAHRAVIAESMDCSSWDELALRIESHRAGVQEAFNALFEMEPRREESAKLVSWLMDPQAAPDPDGLADDLKDAGIADAKPVARRLIEFTRSARYRKLSSVVRTKCEKLLPKVVAAIAAEDGAEGTANRMLSLLEAIDGREAYYSLLLEFPQVLKRATHLAARSAWAARLLARHPILLDELTRSAASFTATDWAAEGAALRVECAQLAPDLERLLDHLRHFKQRHMLRLTIADVEDEIAVMALSDELSALADTVLGVTMDFAAASIGLGHEAGGVPGFCIVGYGKLGGKELGYGSDLDIIFLYDEANAPPAEKLGRLAQRVSSWLTSHTAAGVLYETDLRLRPDGASGLLVSSIAAFRDYQEKRAWTWEHQALTRARFAAGDAAPGARFESLRDEILAQPRDPAKLFADIVAMRKKMRGENRGSTDLKHVAGGVIDLEFAVQAMVLAHGPQHPELRENKGNHTLLKRMGGLVLIDAQVATEAAEAYLAMRQRIHRAALNDEETVRLAPDEMPDERAAVMRLWKAVFGE
ncbi:MAG TPA: bifunctional [glutamate--ammonia ligase]-adenylyl-L-tyrosine phosphorylase/[glutamate--ammonia-ligase] adenylyltransferase [Usitatibacter sp.]|nr:bifunctional [glutamate--ammonia ligase]-adenylyl-L-tyrosine phosphorylase/[glutamate--ammonia-ligase] adenylyltransferase [Usitatibacter sp.]